MDNQKLHTILQLGESIAVEFKRCGNGIENDVYETDSKMSIRFRTHHSLSHCRSV